MDYTPPPDLAPHYVFAQAVRSHFFWRFNEFSPVLSLGELWELERGAESRREPCLRGLQQHGRCETADIPLANGDRLTIRMDRACLQFNRSGSRNSQLSLPVPVDIGRKLPTPREKPLEPLVCSKTKLGTGEPQLMPGYASVAYRFLPVQGYKRQFLSHGPFVQPS